MNSVKDIIQFGKYRGKSIEDVMKIDAQYLLWAEEAGMLRFDSDTQEGISETAHVQRAEWLRERCENEQWVEF